MKGDYMKPGLHSDGQYRSRPLGKLCLSPCKGPGTWCTYTPALFKWVWIQRKMSRRDQDLTEPTWLRQPIGRKRERGGWGGRPSGQVESLEEGSTRSRKHTVEWQSSKWITCARVKRLHIRICLLIIIINPRCFIPAGVPFPLLHSQTGVVSQKWVLLDTPSADHLRVGAGQMRVVEWGKVYWEPVIRSWLQAKVASVVPILTHNTLQEKISISKFLWEVAALTRDRLTWTMQSSTGSSGSG